MIKREEAKEKLANHRLTILNYKMEKVSDDVSIGLVTRSDEGNQYNLARAIIDELFDQQDQLQQHIKSLEAQLANTEQLTCDGCINKPNIGDNYDDICGYCSRFYSDHYTYIEGGLQ